MAQGNALLDRALTRRRVMPSVVADGAPWRRTAPLPLAQAHAGSPRRRWRKRHTAGVVLAVAFLHAAVVVVLLTGALLALRCRSVLLVHAPVACAVAAVHVAGADCPLTTWEQRLRARSGEPYDGGFLEHYAFGPLGLDAADATVQLGTYAVVLLPNVLGYGLLAARTRRRGTAAPRLS